MFTFDCKDTKAKPLVVIWCFKAIGTVSLQWTAPVWQRREKRCFFVTFSSDSPLENAMLKNGSSRQCLVGTEESNGAFLSRLLYCLVFFYRFLFFFCVVLLEMIVLNTMLEKVGSAGLAQKSAMVHFRLSFCRRRPFNYFLCCLILHRGHHCSASRDLQLILPTFSSSVTSYITSYHI